MAVNFQHPTDREKDLGVDYDESKDILYVDSRPYAGDFFRKNELAKLKKALSESKAQLAKATAKKGKK